MNVACAICDKQLQNRKGLSYHVKVAHKTQFVDYVIQHENAGIHPNCLCGCGQQVKFFGGKFMFYVDHHQPGKPQTESAKLKISLAQMGKVPTAETNLKRSIATKRYHVEHPEFAEATSKRMTGRTVSDETKNRMSTTRSRLIASGDIVINSDAISETVTNLYINGGFAWAKGVYSSTKTGKKHTHRSSWELLRMKQLDSDDEVVLWESESVVIMYEFKGKVKRYVPDLIITMLDGTIIMEEVKPVKLRTLPMNQSKRLAAEQYCDKRRWEYREWSPEAL